MRRKGVGAMPVGSPTTRARSRRCLAPSGSARDHRPPFKLALAVAQASSTRPLRGVYSGAGEGGPLRADQQV